MAYWMRLYKITPGNIEMQALLLSIIGQIISRKILLNCKELWIAFFLNQKQLQQTAEKML